MRRLRNLASGDPLDQRVGEHLRRAAAELSLALREVGAADAETLGRRRRLRRMEERIRGALGALEGVRPVGAEDPEPAPSAPPPQKLPVQK